MLMHFSDSVLQQFWCKILEGSCEWWSLLGFCWIVFPTLSALQPCFTLMLSWLGLIASRQWSRGSLWWGLLKHILTCQLHLFVEVAFLHMCGQVRQILFWLNKCISWFSTLLCVVWKKKNDMPLVLFVRCWVVKWIREFPRGASHVDSPHCWRCQ